MRLVMDLRKANPVEDNDGMLTQRGMRIAHEYARMWLREGKRDLHLEREYPELAGLFYDIRTDVTLAREHAIPMEPGEGENIEKSIVLAIPLDAPEPEFDRRKVAMTPGGLDCAKIAKVPLPRSSLDVWLVDGKINRDTVDVEFIGGGHHFRYEWIPLNEVWLEADASAEDIRFYLLHELCERAMMVQGECYENAHAAASNTEEQARKDPKTLEPAIMTAVLKNIVAGGK